MKYGVQPLANFISWYFKLKIAENNPGKLGRRWILRKDIGLPSINGKPNSEDDSNQKMLRRWEQSLPYATELRWLGCHFVTITASGFQTLPLPPWLNSYGPSMFLSLPQDSETKAGTSKCRASVTRQHFTTGDKERGVCPLSLLWWKAGNCSINSDRRVSKCEGAKNDRFPLTFGITKIRTILYVIDQNKFHMDSEYKCKTWNHKSIWRKYTWIFM